jgi:uncharacterized membrane protein YdjX (TVP38/TMEM64 family)
VQKKKDKKDIKKSKTPLIISFVLLASIVLLYFVWPEYQAFFNEAYEVLTSNDNNRISNWVSQFGIWGPLIIVLGMVVQIALFVIPSFLLMIISILAYGPVWGSLIVLVAIFTAASVGYIIGAYLGEVTVSKLIGEKTQKKVKNYVEDYGFWAVIITRLSPILSNDAISVVAGLLKLQYFKFIAATFSGIIPLTILIAILGEDFENLKEGLIWISVVSIAGLGAYIIYDRKFKRK